MSTPLWKRARCLALLLGALLASGACGGGGTSPAPDGPIFYVASSDPVDGQQAVPIDSYVSVTFNQAVDPDSVNINSLRVGVIGGQGEIPGTAVLDSGDGRTVRWTPSEYMAPVEAHACEVSPGIRSIDGVRVGGSLSITFRTAAEIPIPDLPGREDLKTLPGSLHVGRRGHTATHLLNGRVLIAGGYTQGTAITDRAELYIGQFFSLISDTMREERAGHAATLLANGHVLLTGGWYETSPGLMATTDGAEIYDPTTATFRPVGAMTTDRVDHAALQLPDGRVLVTGGSRYEGTFLRDLDSAEVYDPTTETFSALAEPMIHSHATHVMLDQGSGKFLIYGGSDVDLRPEWYDVATGTFEALLPAASDGVRWGAAGDTFASGGASVAGGDDLGTVIYVDAATGVTLNTGSGLTVRRWYATSTRITDDRILVVGGIDYTNGSFLNPTCDVVIEGGIGGSRTYGCEMRFPTGMVDHTATALSDGTVLFCGGLNAIGGAPELSAAYLYDPD